MSRQLSLPVRNAIAGACIGLLFWLPTILWVIVLKSYDDFWLWLVQLIAIILIGALAGAVGTLPAARHVASHWRGGLSGFVVAALFGVLIFTTVITPANFPHTFLEQLSSRLIVITLIVTGGTIAGAISAITLPGTQTQADGAFQALAFSLVGPVVGGALPSFIVEFALVLLQVLVNPLPPFLSSFPAANLGLIIVPILSAISCGLGGGLYAVVGAGTSYMGDSTLGRAMGAAFGTSLGLLLMIAVLLLFTSIQ